MTQKIFTTVAPSGEELNYIPLSMTGMLLRLQKQFPKPDVPMQRVEIMGQETYEPNYSSESYKEQVREWEEQLGTKVTIVAMRTLALAQTLNKERKDALQMFKLANQDVIEVDDNDRIAWFENLVNDKDKDHLMKLARGEAEPTEEGVNNYVNHFQSDVQGA